MKGVRFAVAVLVVVASACGKAGYTREDLDTTLALHHINLHWGRFENAAVTVHPEMRAAFLQSWAGRVRDSELQDIDVTGVVVSEDGDRADVIVTITWVDRSSMSVRSSLVPEVWLRTDQGWVASKPAALQ